MRHMFVPALLIVLAVPMILQKVPRNSWYGFRTPYTLSSDQVWYRANRISGVTLAAAGAVWLALVLVMPRYVAPRTDALRLAQWYGMAALALSVAVSFWLTYRGR
jgi:uncharacterized membrane protein